MFLCASLIGSAFFLPETNVIPTHLDKFHVFMRFLNRQRIFFACDIPRSFCACRREKYRVNVINELLSKLQRRVSLFQIELNLSDNSYSYLIVMLFP